MAENAALLICLFPNLMLIHLSSRSMFQQHFVLICLVSA